jgi:uncharacterized protein Yka (UPF0111/DUF47 family)
MLFGKLLPREGNFFEMFNEHGKHIADGARAFQSMVQNYNDEALREKYGAEVDGAEQAGRQDHRRGQPPAAQDLHHADRPRADPRLINAMDDILDLLQDSSEVMSLYDVKNVSDDVLRLDGSR